ncbi:oxygen-independent coproporphyrinogen III oxidase [Flavihumibacter profundi]|uniref:oxygen-independent coproporphyrinogen III oxidase n=1 Tax=Flavihumibacter profundi TaxID=2716883 RepID=UPI001CC4310E|nr:oxygen-independent coproporphyrinogen III oxidase [Flavihumibacter profundi]MBZ5858580.1 oxygen-independent coproporphyrinogen III oxidase [Flavihumibacter profundi]
MITASLLKKYNQPIPRYTSYPTVPNWKEKISTEDWAACFSKQFTVNNSKEGISLYIHLPFCESLCTYCGCNKKITTNHSVEENYMDALVKEWELYLQLMPEKPVIRELHLGGGTPTFFSPENLQKLLETILGQAVIHPDHQFSFEAHPNNTTHAHLLTLYNLGFRRLSLGVQDNDPVVQFTINRIQPFKNVVEVTEWAREIGYTSVNFDLIYGLPKQTPESMERTLTQCIELKPDRVAFYSYAHVPWTSRGQRLFDENDLPPAEMKMQLYRLGKFIFSANGYNDIGMDHFALRNDELFKARQEGRLHRNFMGYTTQATALLLGLGVSSISDAGNGYAQNNKTIGEYYQSINAGKLDITKGYFLSDEDLSFKRYILDISCKGATRFNAKDLDSLRLFSFPQLEGLAEDGLISWDESALTVTPLGHHFIRNICAAFDLYLLKNKTAIQLPTYSKAI